ncbi:MAG: orotate phosphoribosyltransferase [Planctomycetota bacterium]|nr:MAG: orotate phosphoribosyltransferase [Planctomycetota bacterium]
MDRYKEEFIEFMVKSGVLTFGKFKTKSGRLTPFFINTGNYDNGAQMSKLGQFYATAIKQNIPDENLHLYGPAYKGIPLVVTTSIALYDLYENNFTFTFNRKEAKDHGEGGSLVGYKFKDDDKVVIIEDVTTSGASVRESVPILKACAKVKLEALVVSVDRMEKGNHGISALEELQNEYGLKSFAIVNLEEVVEYLSGNEIDGQVILTEEIKKDIDQYRLEYGV